jgi:type II secretory pathway pseudopilin PulG
MNETKNFFQANNQGEGMIRCSRKVDYAYSNEISRSDAEQGFTIQELLVVILVSSLLVSFCLSAFLFATRHFNTWDRKRELANTVDRTLQMIALDIQRSRNIEWCDDSTLVLNKGTGARMTYLFRHATVLRDSITIVPESGIALRVIVQEVDTTRAMRIQVSGTYKGLERTAESFAAYKNSGKAQFVHSYEEEGKDVEHR